MWKSNEKGQDFEQSFHNLCVTLTGYKSLGNAKVKLRRYAIPGNLVKGNIG